MMMNPLRDDCDEPWPITANTGAPIAALDHIGQLDEVAASLATVRGPGNHGAHIAGDRRTGKSSLFTLISHVLDSQDVTVIGVSAETSRPDQFGQRLREALTQVSFLRRELDKWDLSVDVTYQGIGIQRTNKSTADPLVDDLFDFVGKHAGNRQVVLILDEITVLAQGFAQQDPQHADEFLRSLRRVRHEHAGKLTMILSGSIGLHHVVDDLSVISDLTTIRLGKLEHQEAVFHVRCLILGEEIETVDPPALAEAIATNAGDSAYYVHQLAAQAAKSSHVEAADIEAILTRLIEDPDDPCDFRHYRDRLTSYYGPDAPIAEACLNEYALANQPLTIDELANRLAAVTLDRRPPRPELTIQRLTGS